MLTPRLGYTLVFVFAFNAVRLTGYQNSNLSEHERDVHAQSEQATKYFRNADSYPKPLTFDAARFFPPQPNRSANDPVNENMMPELTVHVQTREEYFSELKNTKDVRS